MAKKKKQRKLSYWEGRSVDQEEYIFQGLKPKEKAISKAYTKAQQYLTAEAQKIYDRYLNKSGMSEDEVKRVLNTSVEPAAIVELQGLIKTVQDKEIKKQMTDYLDGLAAKYRITRLEDLKAKSFLVSKQVADVQLQTSTDYFIDVIKDGYEQAAAEGIIGKTDQLVKESFELADWSKGSPKVIPKVVIKNSQPSYAIKDGKPVIEIYDWKTHKVVHTIKISPDKPVVKFKELSTKYVNNILESHWMGSNYSKRIWNDTELLAKKVEEFFTVEAMTGMSERDMANALMNEFNVGYNIAKRLIRTEANYMAGQAKLKGWKEHGVEEYVIVAVLDLRTSETCKNQDGKIYKVAEAICNGKLGNYPPFHPWCRTVVRAYFGKASLQGNRTAIDPLTGKRFKILQSDSYKKWEQMLIEKHGKEDYELFRRKVKNAKGDSRQYNRFKEILGMENVPETFEEFQEIKYNDDNKWKDLMSRFKRQSGALNKYNDVDGSRREEHAARYYETVRNRNKTYDVQAVAANSGLRESTVSKVYDHIFVNKYPLDKGYNRFDPSYDIAQSWQRLRNGKGILPHDLTLLKHERFEYQLMNRYGQGYREAHENTNRKYNYENELDEFMLKERK